jgi:hypothetical protein
VAPPVVLATLVFLLHARLLNLLALGEEDAQSLGVAVHRTRLVLLVAAALATGASVAISGLVGFVGLVVPHLVRLLVGTSDQRVLLPLVALSGALFLLTADTIARVVLQPAELRVGAGELVGLVGPNGSGKTTLLRSVAALIPAEGNVWLTGMELDQLSPKISYTARGASGAVDHHRSHAARVRSPTRLRNARWARTSGRRGRLCAGGARLRWSWQRPARQ